MICADIYFATLITKISYEVKKMNKKQYLCLFFFVLHTGEKSFSKVLLHKVSILPQHSSVVDPKSVRHHFSQLLVLQFARRPECLTLKGGGFGLKCGGLPIVLSLVLQHLRCTSGCVSRVHKYHHLMALLDHVVHLVVADVVHVVHLLQRLARLDAHEGHAERNWPETVVKVKQAFVKVHPQEVGHVDVVRQSG